MAIIRKPAQYAEFIRLMSNPEEADKLNLKSAASYERYFKEHPELRVDNEGNEEEPVTDMTLGVWIRDFSSGSLEDIKRIAFHKGKENPQFMAQYLSAIKIERDSKLSNDYDNDQVARDSEKFIKYFKDTFKEHNGICPLCGFSNILPDEVLPDKVN
jgi:hypothetical protein